MRLIAIKYFNRLTALVFFTYLQQVIIYYVVISVLFIIQRNAMFMFQGLSHRLCIVLIFVSTPFFRNGAGPLIYMFIVLSCHVRYVHMCDPGTADGCPLRIGV